MKKILKLAGFALGAAAGALAFGILRFRRESKLQALRMFDRRVRDWPETITEEMLAGLPEPARRYLRYAGVVGTPQVHAVRLKQKGRIRQDESQPWMPFTAEEYYTLNPPGFVWLASARAGPLPLVAVRDEYVGGYGHMLVEFGGLATMVHERGPEMDQGGLMRLLNEMIWFPGAFLNENVSWEAVDDTSARVTLADRGRSVSAVMHFDEQGRLKNFAAERYRIADGRAERLSWSTPVIAYGTFEGLYIPVLGKGVWHLPDRDLTYIELQVTDLQINIPHLY